MWNDAAWRRVVRDCAVWRRIDQYGERLYGMVWMVQNCAKCEGLIGCHSAVQHCARSSVVVRVVSDGAGRYVAMNGDRRWSEVAWISVQLCEMVRSVLDGAL